MPTDKLYFHSQQNIWASTVNASQKTVSWGIRNLFLEHLANQICHQLSQVEEGLIWTHQYLFIYGKCIVIITLLNNSIDFLIFLSDIIINVSETNCILWVVNYLSDNWLKSSLSSGVQLRLKLFQHCCATT